MFPQVRTRHQLLHVLFEAWPGGIFRSDEFDMRAYVFLAILLVTFLGW